MIIDEHRQQKLSDTLNQFEMQIDLIVLALSQSLPEHILKEFLDAIVEAKTRK